MSSVAYNNLWLMNCLKGFMCLSPTAWQGSGLITIKSLFSFEPFLQIRALSLFTAYFILLSLLHFNRETKDSTDRAVGDSLATILCVWTNFYSSLSSGSEDLVQVLKE